jgi:RluA family pseudouridine synthase
MEAALQPSVRYSDADLLVIDKPAGLLSIHDGYDRSIPYVGRLLEPTYGRLWVVHRLDKETSGLMVLARNAEAHRALNLQFDNRQVSKTYHAIIVGVPLWDEITNDAPLRTNVGRCNRTTVDFENGKPAVTRFQVIERFASHTLLSVHPETGRTHQIRAHLYHLSFSILSDPFYGEGEISPLMGRLALHAKALSFWHPTKGELLSFDAPYPWDFESTLANLRNA